MAIRTGVGFMMAIRSAIHGNGAIFAIALAGLGIQGCTTDDSPVSPVTEESQPAEIAVAAKAASNSGTVTTSKYLGGGCTLNAILTDAGSQARANAWISCDHKEGNLGFIAQLWDASEKKSNFIHTACPDKYWCGTGNLYVKDHAGKQKYQFWIWAIAGAHNKEIVLETKF